MWVIVDCGRILWDFGTFASEEDAQDKIDSLSYFGDMLETVEIDSINTDHINDR
jgi:hypothetical protein